MFEFLVCLGCLALAELGRRGLLLPDRLPEGLYSVFLYHGNQLYIYFL